LSQPRRKLTIRRLHILIVDTVLLAIALIEGVKYVLFLIRQ